MSARFKKFLLVAGIVVTNLLSVGVAGDKYVISESNKDNLVSEVKRLEGCGIPKECGLTGLLAHDIAIDRDKNLTFEASKSKTVDYRGATGGVVNHLTIQVYGDPTMTPEKAWESGTIGCLVSKSMQSEAAAKLVKKCRFSTR